MKPNWWEMIKLFRQTTKNIYPLCCELDGNGEINQTNNENFKYIRHNHSLICESSVKGEIIRHNHSFICEADVNGEIMYGYYPLLYL